MSFYSNDLNQTAVYWGGPTKDGYGGDKTFDAGVELSCRWETRQDLYVDDQGQEQRSRAVVYLDQSVEIGAYLYLGELADLSSSPDPLETDEAYRIAAIAEIPDVDGVDTLYKAWLGSP